MPESEENIWLMNEIDEIYTEFPYYGSPKITAELKRRNIIVNHKRIERLMRIMGIEAAHPKKKFNLSQNRTLHETYPYLLNGLDINHPNHVWGTDITYIRAANMWFYLVAILDWYSRYEESLSVYFTKYNTRRLHESLGYRPPAEVYFK